MPSEADIAKRELVKLLRALAAKYGVALTVARESAEKDARQAFRKVSLKAHPDKGGAVADFQKLSAANDAWANACKNSARPGRPAGRPEAREPGTGRGQRPRSGAPLLLGVSWQRSPAILLLPRRHREGRPAPWAFGRPA